MVFVSIINFEVTPIADHCGRRVYFKFRWLPYVLVTVQSSKLLFNIHKVHITYSIANRITSPSRKSMGSFVEEAIFAEGRSSKDHVVPDVIREDIMVWRE